MTFAKPYFLFCLLKKVHSKAYIFQQPEAKYFTLADERKAVFYLYFLLLHPVLTF